MSNELILADELKGLPADLKSWATGLLGLADAACGGISAGGHPRLSTKGRQFTKIDTDGGEVRAGSFNQELGVFLDVVVVGANPAVSKLYYDKPFDPATTEPVAPTCFSDNGVAPSARSEAPQCTTCAACPHNVWGSKVTPGGSQIKACADAKKVAVVLTEDIQGPVYELRIPAASMKGFASWAAGLKTRGVPVPMVVLTLAFDNSATYPKLAFEPARYVDGKTELPVIQEILRDSGEEIAEAVGSKDVPHQGPVAPVPSNVVQMPQQPAQQVAAPQPETPAPTRRRRAAAPAATPEPANAMQAAAFDGIAQQQAVNQHVNAGFDDAPGKTSAVPSDAALDGILAGIKFS